MRTLITCMGEGLIDFLPVQQGENTVGFCMYPAGSILNVAVGIARLGQPVAFAGKIADDYFGRYLRSFITAESIDSRFLATTEGRSALAFVAREAGQPTFSFYGDATADTMLTTADIPAALLAETAILHTGSISLLHETTPETVLTTAERLKGQALLSLDPNIRPDLILDEQGYRRRLQRLMALVDILKLNDVDLAWLLPGKSIEQAINELLALGVALVIVTCGAEGAVIATAEGGILSTTGFSVEVVDTVGAGDTFCAALLSGLMLFEITTRVSLRTVHMEVLRDIVYFASAAAALNCTREGANSPRYRDVEEFLAGR